MPRAGGRLALAVLLAATAFAGCLAQGGEATCSTTLPYGDRLAFTQEGLYARLGETMAEANSSSEATSTSQRQPVWSGERGVLQTVRLDGLVYGEYDASPSENTSTRITDSALASYGPLWLDKFTWHLEDSRRAEVGFVASDGAVGIGGEEPDPQSLVFEFVYTNLTEAQAAERIHRFQAALFPSPSYEPLEDPDFEYAWNSLNKVEPRSLADADRALSRLLSQGLEAREAPFEPVTNTEELPRTIGVLHLEGTDLERFPGEVRLRLGYDVRLVDLIGHDPAISLEVTPADRAFVSSLGEEPLGRERLEQIASGDLADAVGTELDLEGAEYETGGDRSTQVDGSCNGMDVVGEPVDGRPGISLCEVPG